MLTGERVVLRAVEREDVELLETWEHDPAMWGKVSDRPWTPRTLARQLARYDAGEIGRADDTSVPFTIEAGGGPVGQVMLFRVDLHNRSADVGISLAPAHRGKGYASDALRVVLRYAFRERGLHRVELQLLADNEAALRCYEAVGFVLEGRLREHAWVAGRFVDSLVMSVLAGDLAAPYGNP